MKLKVIINPAAGRGKSIKRWKVAEQALRKLEIPFVSYVSGSKEHVGQLAASASAEGYRAIMSVGGDGTLNEIVNSIAGDAQKNIPIVVVSTGTGNDFIKSACLPKSIFEEVRLYRDGKPCPVDLGKFGSRYFINAAGIGFDAEVAHLANIKFGKLRGFLPYALGVLQKLPTYHPTLFKMYLNELEAEFKAWMISVSNGQFYGGGMNVMPGASISDGLLDIGVIGSFKRMEFLRLFPKVYSGKHFGNPKISVYRTKKVHIEAETVMKIQADGEVYEGQSFDFEIHPGAVQIFMPADRCS
ncbi:MAG: diacylglycerol/lipid kinase family protein [Bacillota bacterium]|jgi:diacylglycerol kinase (ATP)